MALWLLKVDKNVEFLPSLEDVLSSCETITAYMLGVSLAKFLMAPRPVEELECVCQQ